MKKSGYSSPQVQIDLLTKMFDHFDKETITAKELHSYVKSNKISFPYFITRDRKVARGVFNIVPTYFAESIAASAPVKRVKQVEPQVSAPAMVAQVINLASRRAQNVTESFVPEKNKTYVPFGFYNDLKNIIKSRIFYPIYITGLSGNGKTMMIEQVCASLGRELVRVNITKRTDESDLIGSYELIDGSTVRREGPVLTAMRRGAVLLLDECDLGTEDILCLQPILEGKPYFDKKTGEVVHPAAGFTVIATANTKGKGSDDGRFIGTNILNEAFLERFAVTVEQEYPPVATERKILEKNFAELGINDDVFIERLIAWADIIRKSFNDGAVDEVISTRRLVHISKAFSIFNNRLKAIEMCLNRFDTDTKTSFLDLYTKVDAEATAPAKTDEAKIEFSTDPNTFNLNVTVIKNGNRQSATVTPDEFVQYQNQGLNIDQVVDRVAKTLIIALDREAEDIPF